MHQLAPWRPDPGATYVDVFRLHGKQFFYDFPLVSLISHYLHKIIRVEAEGIMIQLYFSLFKIYRERRSLYTP